MGCFLRVGHESLLGDASKLRTIPYLHWRRVIATELWADGLV